MSDPLHGLVSFLAELKRRRVYRVGVVYAAVAFILLQGVDLMADPLGLPPVVMTVLVVVALFGFPLALVLAWAFEVTPEGVQRTGTLPEGSNDTDPDDGSTPPATPGRALGITGAAGVLGMRVLVAGAVGWWLLVPSGPAGLDVSTIRSVAVLPLSNLSGDPEEAPFVSGMHEELIDQLGRAGTLRVNSRTSVMRYRDESLRSLPEIGRELDADAILEGSVLRVDDEVRITVTLIHAPTDTHLWSESFDRELSGVPALHSDVARSVADQVQAVLTPEESRRLARTREVNPAALEHHVRGRYLWNQREEEPLRQALSEFEAAIDVDPTYAEAWAGIADTYLVPAGANLAPDGLARGIEAARRALALDGTLAEAHTSLAYGLLGTWAWEESEHHFRRAIELNPSYAPAHQWYAEFLVARSLRYARQPRKALETLHRMPSDHPREVMLGVAAHLDLGQPDSAWAYLLNSPAFPPPMLAELQRVRGNTADPVSAFHFLLEESGQMSEEVATPIGGEVPPVAAVILMRLQTYMGQGRSDEALDLLLATVTDGPDIGPGVVDLVAEPLLDPLRDDPRIRAFLREVRLADRWPPG